MTQQTDEEFEGERIAKVLARRGVCSRREAERMIAEGLVFVDGVRLTTPAFKVKEEADIRVNGARIPAPMQTRLWRYHKPPGLITANRDPDGRPSVFDNLPKDLPRVISIGRLDLNSEGLLLLTNDGALARALELPSTGWRRRYRVRVYGQITEADLKKMRDGIMSDGQLLKAEAATIESQTGQNSWINITLTEGKNREIRRMVEAVGGQVNRLIRTAFGSFQLGTLKNGEVEEVPGKILREQTGKLLSPDATRKPRQKKQNHADRRR